MTVVVIEGVPVEAEPRARDHVEAYARMVELALAVDRGEQLDGAVLAGDLINPTHVAPGMMYFDPETGLTYDFKLLDDHLNTLSPAQVHADDVSRDRLGLALEPGVNGRRGRLTIYMGKEAISEAFSSGSVHDWHVVGSQQ